MDLQKFIDTVLAQAVQAGIEVAEVYYSSEESFQAMAVHGDIANYAVNQTGGLALRGLYEGKMGYASTEAMDDEAVVQLIQGVIESAQLIEDEDKQFLFKGSDHYQLLDTSNHMDTVDESEKLKFVLELEKEALSISDKISQVPYAMLQSSLVSSCIKNTYGLNLSHKNHYVGSYVSAFAKDGEKVSSEGYSKLAFKLEQLDLKAMAKEAVERTLFMLDAQPIESGSYKAVLHHEAMLSLLATFSGVFSAENAQKGMSLLNDKEGEKIAADCVTICDDPLLANGIASPPFDDEGVATFKKNVVENGVLKTLLHNLKTAEKANKKSTGNAGKAGYSAPVRVAPSNFFFQAGDQSFDALLSLVGDGIVITDLQGMHAGANAITGNFSLSAKGYTIKDGKKAQPINQITVAGNFYDVLKNIQAFADDLTFEGSYGSPSVYVGELPVAGK